MTNSSIAGIVLCALLATSAQAEVVQVADDGFEVRHAATLNPDVQSVFLATVDIARWWHPDHTWSGRAEHLSLDPAAGGCFCERWEDGSVEHLRVLYVQPGRLLRLGGGLGPLQSMNLHGTLEFRYGTQEDGGSSLSMTYRVSGDSLHKLQDLAPVVDQVLGLQFGRLTRFAETGDPASRDTSAPGDDAAGRTDPSGS